MIEAIVAKLISDVHTLHNYIYSATQVYMASNRAYASRQGWHPRPHTRSRGKTRPRQDPRVDFWTCTCTRWVLGGSRAPAGFVDFATAPRLLATAFVVLEAAAATTCPQIAASAVLEAAATAPCPQAPPPPPRRVRGRLCW